MKNKGTRRKKIGLAPGSVVFTGNQKVEQVEFHYLQYDVDSVTDKKFVNHEEIEFQKNHEEKIDWYDVRGIHDTELIEFMGRAYDIHPLVLEDIADIHQRPKFEEYSNGIFVTLRALSFDTENKELVKEQVAIYFSKGILISFQETETDLFKSVRDRIRVGRTRIRERGADYLCYALIDTVVDNYFLLLDQLDEEIERLEEQVLNNPSSKIKEDIHHLKKELINTRKSIAPLREAIGRFSKAENTLIDERTSIFIRDLFDHTVQINDTIESYRDTLNGLQDLYLSEISFQMNKVMQVLTIITTIFVPLSFLAGLYGMNFEYIPELHYRYSYFILLGIMFTIFISLLVYFKRKEWF